VYGPGHSRKDYGATDRDVTRSSELQPRSVHLLNVHRIRSAKDKRGAGK
jgi:hypothetical protein